MDDVDSVAGTGRDGRPAPQPSPLPACGERSEFARCPHPTLPRKRGRVGWGRVRGLRPESGLVETPPYPDPLHSPSKTGVNALMASGESEKKRVLGLCEHPLTRRRALRIVAAAAG